ncbi:MAG: hypothetical protein F6J98_01575 [Moorea sp. SIO4G2]|nr:hypothetical protein [Moorena sp. SIO4G2]
MFDIKDGESHTGRFFDFSTKPKNTWHNQSGKFKIEDGGLTLHLEDIFKIQYSYGKTITDNWVFECDFKAVEIKSDPEAFILFSHLSKPSYSSIENADDRAITLIGKKARGRYLSANSKGGTGMEANPSLIDSYKKEDGWIHYRCPMVLVENAAGTVKSLVFAIRQGTFKIRNFVIYDINSKPVIFKAIDDLVQHNRDSNNVRGQLFDSDYAISVQDNTYKAGMLANHVNLSNKKYLYLFFQAPIQGQEQGILVTYADTQRNKYEGSDPSRLKEFDMQGFFTDITSYAVKKFTILTYGKNLELLTTKGHFSELSNYWVPYRLDLSDIVYRLKRQNTNKTVNAIGFFSTDKAEIDRVPVMRAGCFQFFDINTTRLPPFRPKLMFISSEGLVANNESVTTLYRWVSNIGNVSVKAQDSSSVLIGSRKIAGLRPISGGAGLVSEFTSMEIERVGYCGWIVVQFSKLPSNGQIWTLFELQGLNYQDRIAVTLTGDVLKFTDELASDSLRLKLVGDTDLCLITFYRDDRGCHIEVDDGVIFSPDNVGTPAEHTSTNYRVTLLQDSIDDSDKYEKGLIMVVFSDSPPDITSIKVLNRWVMGFFGIPERDHVPF